MKTFFNLQESNKKLNDQIVLAAGESYEVWELLKIPAVRSGNLIIHEMNVHGLAFNAHHSDLWHCNIELRKRGIEIVLRKSDDRFVWCIPFYQMSVFQSTHLTIHANGYFIRLKNGYSLRQAYVQRMLEMKNEYLQYPPTSTHFSWAVLMQLHCLCQWWPSIDWATDTIRSRCG